MTVTLLPRVFTIEINATPTLMFEAKNLREAWEVCHEEWLKADLAEARSNGVPLWDGKAKLRTRIAKPQESAFFTQAARSADNPLDDLLLVYLVEMDG